MENIRENIKISAQGSLDCCESEHRKQCFDEGCSKLVDQRKQANLQLLQDSNEANEGNLSDTRRESSSKNMNLSDLFRGINEFMKGYQT
jgi:hypothetical protein